MDFEPERWETVVEDVAQVLALGLERAEDLADMLNDLLRGRPGLPKVAAAVAVGMVLGTFAERVTRARRTAPPQFSLPRRPVPPQLSLPRLLDGRRPTPDVSRVVRRLPVPSANLGGVRSAAQLLPVAMTLLKNPLVRNALVGFALRAGSRRVLRH